MKGPVPILNISQEGVCQKQHFIFFPYFVCSKLKPGCRAAAAAAAAAAAGGGAAGAGGAETEATLPPRGFTDTHGLF